MKSVQIMMEEHKNIKRVLKVIRKLCIKILNNEDIDYNIFYKIIDFIRNYADNHHHSKEEKILFKKILQDLDSNMGQSPVNAMLSEHHLARYYVGSLENAVREVQEGKDESRVDIIANAISYSNLLDAHIQKENNVLYKFGERHLSDKSKAEIEKECEEIEDKAKQDNLQNKYLEMVEELEKNY